MSEDKIIVDLLRELREDQKANTELLHKHTIILTVMQNDVKKNTKDLNSHIEGVIQNRKRVEVLESDKRFKADIKRGIISSTKLITAFGTLSGIIYSVYAYISNFS